MNNFSDYIIYVDESGDANWKAAPEYPLLCLNYCLFEKEHYLNELIPMFNKLKFKYWGCDNIILHERDLRKPDKVRDPAMRSKYNSLKGEKRDAFMEEVTALMSTARFLCFCIIIDKTKVPKNYQVYDPYNIALSRGFIQIHNFMKLNHPEQLMKQLHFVFEKRGRDVDASLSKAYKQILLQGALTGQSPQHDFSNFKLELMDKKGNSTGIQIADLTARPIGNHYLHSKGIRHKIDQRSAQILLNKMRYCSDIKCETGKYDVFHKTLPQK